MLSMEACYPKWTEEGISDHWKIPSYLGLYWALGDVTANQWELVRLQLTALAEMLKRKSGSDGDLFSTKK